MKTKPNKKERKIFKNKVFHYSYKNETLLQYLTRQVAHITGYPNFFNAKALSNVKNIYFKNNYMSAREQRFDLKMHAKNLNMN